MIFLASSEEKYCSEDFQLVLPKAESKAEFIGHDAEDRQSKTCKLVMWGGALGCNDTFLNWGSVAGGLGNIAMVMLGFCEKLSLLRLSPLYRTEISENDMTNKASHCFTSAGFYFVTKNLSNEETYQSTILERTNCSVTVGT